MLQHLAELDFLPLHLSWDIMCAFIDTHRQTHIEVHIHIYRQTHTHTKRPGGGGEAGEKKLFLEVEWNPRWVGQVAVCQGVICRKVAQAE